MALFDDNYGKDLTNATIWLESANDSGGSDPGDSGDSGCGLRTLVSFLAVIVVICNVLFTCIAKTM